jgi:hypothetical protein
MKTYYSSNFDSIFSIENRISQTNITLSGKMIELEPDAIWTKILDWFNNYQLNPSPETTISLSLIYINTRNLVELFKFLRKFEKMNPNISKVSVNWICETGDFDMADIGADINVLTTLPVKTFFREAYRKSA